MADYFTGFGVEHFVEMVIGGQEPAPAGMPHQACLVKKREKVFVNPDFVRSAPLLNIYAVCVGIVP